MTGTIYGLIDGDTLELRYIGQTIQELDARFSRHKAGGRNPHLTNWLAARPVNIITLERSPANLNEAEIRWILAMREQGARPLNRTEGGMNRGPNSLETRAKISAANQGREVKNTTRAKISRALTGRKGRVTGPTTRAKISAALLGRPVSVETRAKIRASLQGHPVSAETREKLSRANKGKPRG